MCTLAAGKDGVDRTRFEDSDEWLENSDEGYDHVGSDARIAFPADDDKIARICVVTVTLGSQGDQDQVITALTVLLKQKPQEQTDSLIWMFGAQRGLQIYLDRRSATPEMRLIGAAF